MLTVLITGGNRGIGLELVKAFLAKEDYKVIAAVRDPASMPDLGEELVVMKLDAGSKTDAAEAVQELATKHGITKLDIVIANAAINVTGAEFKDLDLDVWEETMKVNVRGPLVLFQATYKIIPPQTGKFVIISSASGTIGRVHRCGEGVYGQSKAAVNFLVAKLHAEHEDLIILSLNPGWVPTDMGSNGAKRKGLDKTPNTLEETIPGVVHNIETATKSTLSGYMTNWDGTRMDW